MSKEATKQVRVTTRPQVEKENESLLIGALEELREAKATFDDASKKLSVVIKDVLKYIELQPAFRESLARE